MALFAYSIYDVKTKAYHTPFFQEHRGQAIRAFAEAALDSKTQISKYPDEFKLFEIGSFYPESGVLAPFDGEVDLGFARDYLPKDYNS